MSSYIYKQRNKLYIFIGAVIIGILSTAYTQSLVKTLKEEETKKIKLWAAATEQLVSNNPEKNSASLALEVLKNNTTVPVILTNKNDNIFDHRNLDLPENKPEKFLAKQLATMKSSGSRIEINLGNDENQYLYYKTSTLLVELTWFPAIQLLIIGIFIIIAYAAFNNSRKAEQNQVWVGMAKETAHQLGTPISSMMGWMDLLALKTNEEDTINEVKKDITRLQNITDRFSKIGSKPVLKEENLLELTLRTTEYFKSRISSQIKFNIDVDKNLTILANDTLIGWVFENLTKNAIDAMKGVGEISIKGTLINNKVAIDFSDTGKGIPKSNFKSVFKPGFTTKKRGWGLGLSLTKRIIEEYHQGKIFVKESEAKQNTTFRILL